MTEKLISLFQAAALIGLSHTNLYRMKRLHVEGFPVPVAQGIRGNDLYLAADFIVFGKKQRGEQRTVFDNEMAQAFIRGQLC